MKFKVVPLVRYKKASSTEGIVRSFCTKKADISHCKAYFVGILAIGYDT